MNCRIDLIGFYYGIKRIITCNKTFDWLALISGPKSISTSIPMGGKSEEDVGCFFAVFWVVLKALILPDGR